MKQIFYFVPVLQATQFLSSNRQLQYQRHRNKEYKDDQNIYQFYYYPQSNVYRSLRSGQFIYNNRNGWIIFNHVPHAGRLQRESMYVVNFPGFNV